MTFLSPSIIVALATCGRIGYMGKAPGTNGAAVGLIAFILLYYSVYGVSPIAYSIIVGLITAMAIWVCGRAEVLLKERDPSVVILDEIVALPFCFLGLDSMLQSGQAWWVLILGFVLFRFFDIVKPWPINPLQKLPGGWGVVVDDLAAALATAFTLHVLLFVVALF